MVCVHTIYCSYKIQNIYIDLRYKTEWRPLYVELILSRHLWMSFGQVRALALREGFPA